MKFGNFRWQGPLSRVALAIAIGLAIASWYCSKRAKIRLRCAETSQQLAFADAVINGWNDNAFVRIDDAPLDPNMPYVNSKDLGHAWIALHADHQLLISNYLPENATLDTPVLLLQTHPLDSEDNYYELLQRYNKRKWISGIFIEGIEGLPTQVRSALRTRWPDLDTHKLRILAVGQLPPSWLESIGLTIITITGTILSLCAGAYLVFLDLRAKHKLKNNS